MKFEYEQIDDNTWRAKVPGGWIVKTYEPVSENVRDSATLESGWNWRISTCFVPDTNHEWEVEEC